MQTALYKGQQYQLIHTNGERVLLRSLHTGFTFTVEQSAVECRDSACACQCVDATIVIPLSKPLRNCARVTQRLE